MVTALVAETIAFFNAQLGGGNAPELGKAHTVIKSATLSIWPGAPGRRRV